MKLIYMSFDGEYKTESAEFDTVEKAGEYSNNLGSKWFFYPFHFVVSPSCKTVIAPPYMLEWMRGMRVKTVSAIFRKTSALPEMQGVDVDAFAYRLSA